MVGWRPKTMTAQAIADLRDAANVLRRQNAPEGQRVAAGLERFFEGNIGRVDEAIRRRLHLIPFPEQPTVDDAAAALPLTESHGHIWLHPECWNDWRQDRWEWAQQALAAVGLGALTKYA